MASIIEWRRQRKIAKRDKRLRKETDNDQSNERYTLLRATLMTAAGILGVSAAFMSPLVQQYLLLQIGCGIGMAGVGLRYAVYLDMYAVQRVHDGGKGRIINKIESMFRKMPFRYLGMVKVVAHDARQRDLAYIKELREKKEREPENKVVIDKDITSFNSISYFTDGSRNLKLGTFAALGIGVGLTRNATEIAVDFGVKPFVKIVGRFTGYTTSAAFSLAQLGVYSTKRIAAGNKDYVPHPLHQFLIEKTHKFTMATPVHYASWWFLYRGNRKIKKLEISPALRAHLDETGRSQQLAFLDEAAKSPRRMKAITMEWLRANKEATDPQQSSSILAMGAYDPRNTGTTAISEMPGRTNTGLTREQAPPDFQS